MALTKFTDDASIIGKVGTTVQERGLTTQEFKDEFDKIGKLLKAYLNNTLTAEVDNLISNHIGESFTKVVFSSRDLSIAGAQTINIGIVPKGLIIFISVDGEVGKFLIGMVGQNGQFSVYSNHNSTPDSWATFTGLVIINGPGNYTSASCTINGDGTITLTWAKAGTGATGTANISIFAVTH